MIFTSKNIDDTAKIAHSLGQVVQEGLVILLRGTLGAGKTSFSKSLADGMGINPEQVSSPTFTILQRYEADEASLSLSHYDLYRLESEEDFYSAGLGEVLDEEVTVHLIEWPEIILDSLDRPYIDVQITAEAQETVDLDEDTIVLAEDNRVREIVIEAHGELAEQVLANFESARNFPSELVR